MKCVRHGNVVVVVIAWISAYYGAESECVSAK